MRAALNRHRIEVLLVMAVIVAVYYGAQGLLSLQDARADYRDAADRWDELEAEAAQYDIAALTGQRDRLEAAPVPSVFPSRDEVEPQIAVIAGRLDTSTIELGPIVMSEISEEVTDADLGLPGMGARTYDGIEMSLSIGGDVFDLLDRIEQLLAAVPNAALHDLVLSLPEAPGEPSSLSFSVLLYYEGDE